MARGPLPSELLVASALREPGFRVRLALSNGADMPSGDQRRTHRLNIPALFCHCAKCGHDWIVVSREAIGQVPDRPAQCEKCDAPEWWEPGGADSAAPLWIRQAALAIVADASCHQDADRVEMIIEGAWRLSEDPEREK
jgi:hypothetical protein